MEVFAGLKKAALAAAFAVALLATVMSATLASSASLGGILAGSLLATNRTDVPKNLSMSDDFVGTNGSINGRTLSTGQKWAIHRGAWAISSNKLGQTNTATTFAMASLPWINGATTVTAALTTTSSQYIGIYLQGNSNGTAATVLRVRNNGSAILCRLSSSSTCTQLATATSAGGSATWALTYDTGVCTVTRNGAQVLTYTVPVASRAGYEANTRVGVISIGNVSATGYRWTSFSAASV